MSVFGNHNHKCWKEEAPVFTVGVALTTAKKENTIGTFSRGSEILDYRVRFDLKLVYVR